MRLVHASRGKYVRAEPVSALYDQGRVHHVGAFAALEDQMAGFTPDLDRAPRARPTASTPWSGAGHELSGRDRFWVPYSYDGGTGERSS